MMRQWNDGASKEDIVGLRPSIPGRIALSLHGIAEGS